MTTDLDKFVFMKVGRHAGEDFDSILQRKRDEVRHAGMSFWGYGGPTCHPITQVRPFVREVDELGGAVYLVMETIDSKADPDIIPATEYSEDGIIWKPIPDGITVTGSRYAIVLGEIKKNDFELPLHKYAIALGKSEGKSADAYIQGRVDKACLALKSKIVEPKGDQKIARVTHIAQILEPFAVLLRGELR